MGTVTHTFVSPVADAGNPNEVSPNDWNATHTLTGTFPPDTHVHAESDVTNLVSDLALKAPLASPALTGTPTSPTPTAGDNTTKIATTAFVTAAAAAGGKVAQMVSTQTGAVATTTTLIPYDDTIPQITEGTEFMTCAITPTSATNKLKIEVVVFGAPAAGGVPSLAALFQDSTANALAAGATLEDNGFIAPIIFIHYMTAGTTSSTTFRVRAGQRDAGTYTFNGSGSARKLGGVMASSIAITEYTP